MRTYRIPRTDFAVSRLAYGVGMLRNDWNADGFIERSVRAIRTARDCGVTLFDTADVYAGGQSEVALGRVLRESKGLRQQIIIQTKCGLQLQRDWNPSRPPPLEALRSRWSPCRAPIWPCGCCQR